MPSRLAVLRAILGNRLLVRVEAAFLLFSISEWATWVAIVVFAYGRGGPGEAGVVAFVLFLPSVVVAPAAAVIGDRLPRARMLALSYAIEAAAFVGAAIALVAAPPLVAYGIATVAATSITLTRPAHSALAPEIVANPDELAAANVASGTVEGIGALIGPAIAGVVVALAGPAAIYGATAVAASVAFLLVLPIAIAARPVAAIPAGASGASEAGRPSVVAEVARELRVGIRTIFAERRLVAVLVVLAGSITLLGALNVFYAVIAIDLLHLEPSAVGYLAAVGGLGAVLGAAGSSILVGRERLAGVTVTVAILFGIAVAIVGITPLPLIVIPGLAAAGAGWAFVYVESRTLAQRLAGDDVMSRVFGVVESLMMAAQATGALLVPLLVLALGPGMAIVVSGVALAIGALVVAPVLIRADRLDPERIRRLRALRAVPMFAPLAAPVLERLAEDSTALSAPAGTTVVTEGDVGDRFYVIVSGSVDVIIRGTSFRRLGAGDSFGEIALIHDVPRTATVRALEPLELLSIERTAFLDALTGQPRSRAVAVDITTRRLAEGSRGLLS